MEVRTCKPYGAVENTAKNLTELICKSRACDAVTIMKQMEKEFSNIIKDFFSDSCGEGERIRQVYQKVGEFTARYPRINIQDINYANHLYNEYMMGMRMFISNELQNADTHDAESVRAKVEGFLEKDLTFVNSLFANGSNVKMSENITMRDSLGNLEVLIDFINEFHDRTAFVEQMRSMTEDFGNTNEDIAGPLMRFYLLSNVRYIEKLILSVFESFGITEASMNTPRYNITSSNKETVKPQFQLF